MIKYPKQNKELKLGISSISDGANEKLNVVLDYFKKNNIPFEYSTFIFESNNQVSSTAENRGNNFLKMWNNENINYILAAFGGEFCMEILPYIYKHSDSFKYNKKWIQGFSDSNFLTYFLTTNYNIATINYYNAEDYGSKRNIAYLKQTIDRVLEFKNNYEYMEYLSKSHIEEYSRAVDDLGIESLKTIPKCSMEKVEFSGRLIGGWIEAISTICGTKYDNTKKYCDQFDEGVIWYIDNCELTSPALRRKLWQLLEAGYFANCNGILIGRQPDDEFTGDYCYSKAISDTFSHLNIPVIEDVDIGHFFPQWLIVNGSYAKVNYENNKVQVLQRLKK